MTHGIINRMKRNRKKFYILMMLRNSIFAAMLAACSKEAKHQGRRPVALYLLRRPRLRR
jgi:hypothetical protein